MTFTIDVNDVSIRIENGECIITVPDKQFTGVLEETPLHVLSREIERRGYNVVDQEYDHVSEYIKVLDHDDENVHGVTSDKLREQLCLHVDKLYRVYDTAIQDIENAEVVDAAISSRAPEDVRR